MEESPSTAIVPVERKRSTSASPSSIKSNTIIVATLDGTLLLLDADSIRVLKSFPTGHALFSRVGEFDISPALSSWGTNDDFSRSLVLRQDFDSRRQSADFSMFSIGIIGFVIVIAGAILFWFIRRWFKSKRIDAELPVRGKEGVEIDDELAVSEKESEEIDNKLPVSVKEGEEDKLPVSVKEGEEDKLPVFVKEGEEDKLPVSVKEVENASKKRKRKKKKKVGEKIDGGSPVCVKEGEKILQEIRSIVVLEDLIGMGSSSEIYKGYWFGQNAAIKRFLVNRYEFRKKEIDFLIELASHENIVRYLGSEKDKNFGYLAIELCLFDLEDLIICNKKAEPVTKNCDALWISCTLSKKKKYPSTHLLKLMRNVVEGLKFLHENKIVHRDLKPRNILMVHDPKNDSTLMAKLSDMGLSKRLTNGSSLSKRETGGGTAGWMAPEVLQGQRQTRAVDMFSLGCVLFFCLTKGHNPFGMKSRRDINILNNQTNLKPLAFLPEALDIVSLLLDPCPEKRPKAHELLAHPFFWDAEKQISFICDVSEYLKEKASVQEKAAVESKAGLIFSQRWDRHLLPSLLKKRGKSIYNFFTLEDLLRCIRNNKAHYIKFNASDLIVIGSRSIGFRDYFLRHNFPQLLIETYYAMAPCKAISILAEYYE